MTDREPSLYGLVGQVVGVMIPFLNQKTTTRVKLHAVESSGLWIESQELTNQLLAENERRSAPATVILFVPFQQIQFVVGTVPVPSLLEEP